MSQEIGRHTFSILFYVRGQVVSPHIEIVWVYTVFVNFLPLKLLYKRVKYVVTIFFMDIIELQSST